MDIICKIIILNLCDINQENLILLLKYGGNYFADFKTGYVSDSEQKNKKEEAILDHPIYFLNFIQQ